MRYTVMGGYAHKIAGAAQGPYDVRAARSRAEAEHIVETCYLRPSYIDQWAEIWVQRGYRVERVSRVDLPAQLHV